MSSDDQFRAPAGWYPDPLGFPQLRWWNNHGWTEQVSAAPEPLVMQETRVAWKEDEPQAPVNFAPAPTRSPAAPTPPVAPTLNQLESPRAAAKVEEPSTYTKYAVSDWKIPGGPETTVPPVQAAPPVQSAPPAAAPSTPPPPYWDQHDTSRPTPSVDPADLKFWPASKPEDVRRMAREQALRDSQSKY